MSALLPSFLRSGAGNSVANSAPHLAPAHVFRRPRRGERTERGANAARIGTGRLGAWRNCSVDGGGGGLVKAAL